MSDGLDDGEETAAMAVHSRLLQLQYAWRVGMSREEEERLAAEAEEIARRQNDLHSLALLKVATSVRPGLEHYGPDWIAAVEETVELADRSGDRHLRAAVRGAGAYAYLCVADFEGFERILDEMLEIVGDDGSIGANVVLGSPIAWGLMGKGMVRRERLEFEAAEELFEQALEEALEEEDAETASWIRSNQASLVMRRDPEAALALARRNCELTDRLGDVFSRSLALSNLAWAQLIAEEYEEALEAIEESERLYREAMGNGGELEGWRGQLRARALVMVGRTEEGLAVAEQAARIAGERGMLWSYPVAMLTLARARAAAGAEGVEEAFEEAERVARETGSTTLLMDIEEERELLGSSAAAKPRLLAAALQLGDHQLRVQRRDQVLQRLGAGFKHLHHPLRRDLAGEPFHHHVDLLADQLFQGGFVAEGVVDGEADLLVVAAGAEAADRLDDRHVGGRVAAAVGGQDLELGEAVEHLLGDAIALADLGGAGAGALAGEGAVEDLVPSSSIAGPIGILVEDVLIAFSGR